MSAPISITQALRRYRRRKTLNKPLLRLVANKLRNLEYEKEYNQRVWAVPLSTGCGTAACIAGHIAIEVGVGVDELTRDENAGDQIGPLAERALGLRSEIDFSYHWLFSHDPQGAWPKTYSERLRVGERPSRVAADLLDAIADGKVSVSIGSPGWSWEERPAEFMPL